MNSHTLKIVENKIAQRLKELREEKGLSKYELAKLTGLNQPSFCRWENNQQLPNVESIIILCRFFGCTADYLIGLTDG